MLKILHVTPIYEPAWKMGGVVRSTSLLCRGLVKAGCDVTVFTTNSDGRGYLDVPADVPVDVGGVKVHYFHTPVPGAFRYSLSLKRACRKMTGDFDIVHITSFWNYPGIPAAGEAIRCGVPYLVSTRGTFLPEAVNSKQWKKWLYLKLFDEKILKNAAAFHFTADLERRRMKGFGIRNNSFIVPNGLDMGEFSRMPEMKEAKSSLGFLPDDILVSFIGRLDWIKALDVLIKAFQKIHGQVPGVKILIAGPDGGEERKLRDLVARGGLEEKVFFLGPVNDEKKLNVLAASDLFALVSWSENFGNAGVEAMAAGVPVMVSRNTGISDTVQEDGAGIVVSHDQQEMADALLGLLRDPAALQRMRASALDSARKRFDIDAVSGRMIGAYQDIISGERGMASAWEVV
jgi:glycosyltransferase involved in cell wall biosynthesis